MSEEILQILKNQDLRKIQEDKLGNQAKLINGANSVYPGAHADSQTFAVLRPCNASDPQQLWGSSYEPTADMPVPGVTPAPLPMIRSSGSSTHCVSTAACQPNSSSTPLMIRQVRMRAKQTPPPKKISDQRNVNDCQDRLGTDMRGNLT
eukprot:COSAG06_NODE_187_length_20790_cov_46.433232_17_plen_149_part_00